MKMREFLTTNFFLCVYAYMLLGVEGAGDQESSRQPLLLHVLNRCVSNIDSVEVKLVTDEKLLKHASDPSQTLPSVTYACPPEEVLKHLYMKYCLIRKTFQDEKDKIKECASPAPPELAQDFEASNKLGQCHATKTDYQYSFRFRYCPKIEKIQDDQSESKFEIFRMYHICYSSSEQFTIWTQHIINSPLLFDVEKIPDEVDDDFKLSTETFGLLDEDKYIKMHQAFAGQRKDSEDYMVPQMLVPKEEMAMKLWQATTAHYINVKPLWKQLRQLMNVVNHIIRRVAVGIKMHDESFLKITTTTYSIDSTENTRAYLDNSEKRFPIPDIWCKLVQRYLRPNDLPIDSILIYIHNTPGNPDKIPKQCEKQILCDFKKWSMDTLTEEQTKYAYCCQATETLLKSFFPFIKMPNAEDLMDVEKWLRDIHALAIIAPKNLDLIDPQNKTYHYEVAYDAETLEDGTSAYATREHEQLLYLCPAETEVNTVLERSFNQYKSKNCLFVKDFKPNERKRCETPVKPELEYVVDEQGKMTPCFKNRGHRMYNIGYRQCGTLEYLNERVINKKPNKMPDFERRFLNSYSICFNNNQSETIWTYHEIKSPASDNTLHAGCQHKIEISKEDFQLSQHHYLFRQMEKLYFESQPKNDPANMVPHLMVPKEDKPSEHWQKITSHYVNTAPLSMKLEPLMNLIEERIRKLGNHLLPISVYTRIFNLEDGKEPKKLYFSYASYNTSVQTIYIPDIWCKLVVYQFQMEYIGIAIYLHNTPGNPPLNKPEDPSITTLDNPPLDTLDDAPLNTSHNLSLNTLDNPQLNPFCEERLGCDFKSWSKESSVSPEISDDLIRYAYCCAISKNAMDIFIEKLPIEGNLNLNNLAINEGFK